MAKEAAPVAAGQVLAARAVEGVAVAVPVVDDDLAAQADEAAREAVVVVLVGAVAPAREGVVRADPVAVR